MNSKNKFDAMRIYTSLRNSVFDSIFIPVRFLMPFPHGILYGLETPRAKSNGSPRVSVDTSVILLSFLVLKHLCPADDVIIPPENAKNEEERTLVF
jgi:hypothetical protein